MRHWLEAGQEELAARLAEAGQPPYRAGQFLHWLHRERSAGFEAMKNLPRELRRILAGGGSLRVLEERERRTSPDGLTAKLLFAAPENALLESVLIVEKRLSRRTACLSCMAGCPLGCRFCATGKLGFVRNLTAG